MARELRQRRETAEEMFHHDRVRTELRDRLMRTARVSGDNVTEAEIDTAINHYLASLNTYSDPAPGWETFLARAWIARGKIAAVLAAAAAAAGFWFFLL